MKTGEVSVTINEEPLSLSTASTLIERLTGNFLYSRGQIEKPIDQLRQDCYAAPARQTKLQYAERSTPYQYKGNHLFATPLNPSGVQEPEYLKANMEPFEVPALTELVDELNLQENACSQKSRVVKQSDSVPETPLTTRMNGNPAQKRRVLGKLQEVSVPLTPQLTFKQTKSQSCTSYLLEIMDQIHSHIKSGWQVEQVIILIGSTIMSPRETYVIDLVKLKSETGGFQDDKGRCLRKVMQSLFIDPFLCDLPAPLAPTNCHFVLKVNKACVAENPSSFFVPRLRFYLCQRGTRFTLKVQNVEGEQECSETVYMSSPKPFKAVFGSSPDEKKNTFTNRPRDILDTITS